MANKSDVVVKLVLVFFVSLLSFSIGTYVGRKYSDNQHKMAQLEPGQSTEHSAAEPTREVASEHAETTATVATTKKSDALSDDEIAKLAEEFVAEDAVTKDEKHETAHNDTHADAHAATAHTAPTHAAPAHTAAVEKSAPMPIAQNIAEGKSNTTETSHKTEAKTESRIPSSIPKDVAQYSVGKFTVQIAAFGAKEEAEKKSSELQSKGYKAFVVPAQVKGKNWFRVSVGLFATEKEAKEYRTEFMAKAKVETAMVQKISN